MNSRYPHFKQAFRTAGDTQQFESWVDIGTYGPEVLHTFKYMFHKFKKGIFVHIHKNTVIKFIPFCKAYFINEYADKMKVDPNEYRTFQDMFDYIYNNTLNKIHPRPRDNTKYGWWHNNGIFRYDIPRVELDKGTDVIHDLLIRIAPQLDMDTHYVFFINKRDFPIMTLKVTEPYDSIWGDFDHPLTSHEYPSYCPIFSMTSSVSHADIPMPNWDDTRHDILQSSLPPWDAKKTCAVFRGSSTGLGTLIRNNPRIKLCQLSKKHPDLIDAGCTKWNLRPRKLPGDEYYRTIATKLLDTFPIKNFLSYEQQAEYKYIINVPGYVSSFRLGTLFQLKSVVLHAQSPYHSWYEPMLKPYVHYVPIQSNLANLVKQIHWCMKNDALCQTIAQNAYVFYETHLSKRHQDAYMVKHLSLLPSPTIIGPDDSITVDEADFCTLNPWPLQNFRLPKLFMSHDNAYFLKHHMTPRERKLYTHEYHMYRDYISKLNCAYGWKPVHGLVRQDNDVYTIMDYIPGITLLDYLLQLENKPNFDIVLMALLQICIILSDANGTFGFVHNDCVPWNIIIRPIPPDEFCLTQRERFYRLSQFQCLVWLIDYDKSYIQKRDHDNHNNNDATSLLIHVMYLILSNAHQKHWPSYAIAACTQWFNTLFPQHDAETIKDMTIILDLFKKYDNITSFIHSPSFSAMNIFSIILQSCPLYIQNNVECLPYCNNAYKLRKLLVT